METFLTVYRTRCRPSAVPRRRSACARQTLQCDGLPCARFRHVAIMDA
jgi:hypothetical protein